MFLSAQCRLCDLTSQERHRSLAVDLAAAFLGKHR